MVSSGLMRLDVRDEPSRPFLTPAVIERLLSVLQGDLDVGLVVLEGGNGAFCLGQDPHHLDRADPGPTRGAEVLLERFAVLLRAIAGASCPVMALVDGPAHAGGLGLAAAADLVIASRRATFALPETLLGLVPGVVLPFVARRTGLPRARWLALGGATLDASRAESVGLVDEIADDLEDAVARHLRRLARAQPASVAAVKRLASICDVTPQYEREAIRTFGHLLAGDDTRARLRRFADGLSPWTDEDDDT